MVAWWAIAAAHAAPSPAEGVPVALPAGEDRELWRNAFALAGLSVGAPGPSGPGAELRAVGDRWTGWVRDEKGVQHPISVPAPTDRGAREALAALIASLARPVASAPMVALPPLPPSPAPRPSPKPAPAPTPALPVVEEPLPPAPVVRAPLEIVEVAAPPPVVSDEWLVPEVYERRTWLAAGPALRMRWSFRAAAAIGVWGGVERRGAPVGWRLGVGVEATAPAALIKVEEGMGSLDGKGLAAVTAGRWDLGALGGLSVRWFPNGDLDPNLVPVGVFGGTLGYGLPLGRWGVRLGLAIEADSRRLQVCPLTEECPIPTESATLCVQLWRQ